MTSLVLLFFCEKSLKQLCTFSYKVSKRLSGGTRDRHGSGNQSGARPRVGSTISDTPSTANANSGGLSVTGCLSDFSLYIFHPYGGGQRKFFQNSPSFSGSQHSYLGQKLIFF